MTNLMSQSYLTQVMRAEEMQREFRSRLKAKGIECDPGSHDSFSLTAKDALTFKDTWTDICREYQTKEYDQ